MRRGSTRAPTARRRIARGLDSDVCGKAGDRHRVNCPSRRQLGITLPSRGELGGASGGCSGGRGSKGLGVLMGENDTTQAESGEGPKQLEHVILSEAQQRELSEVTLILGRKRPSDSLARLLHSAPCSSHLNTFHRADAARRGPPTSSASRTSIMRTGSKFLGTTLAVATPTLSVVARSSFGISRRRGDVWQALRIAFCATRKRRAALAVRNDGRRAHDRTATPA